MTIQNKIDRARAAFEQISDYTQEQVDKLVYESAKIIYENAEPLAKMAVEMCIRDRGHSRRTERICIQL